MEQIAGPGWFMHSRRKFAMSETKRVSSFEVQLELRFESLFKQGSGFSFPCNAEGQVDVDSLSERARANYLRAHARVGREFAHPVVQIS